MIEHVAPPPPPKHAALSGGWPLARLHASGVWDESQVVTF
jgi:hypothetical protein